jgi:hypothetical protein
MTESEGFEVEVVTFSWRLRMVAPRFVEFWTSSRGYCVLESVIKLVFVC